MNLPEKRYEDFEYAVGRGFDNRVQRWAPCPHYPPG
jgi:hypothetical protein